MNKWLRNGLVLMLVSALTEVGLWVADWLAFRSGATGANIGLGIINVFVIPPIFIVGLVLVILGLVRGKPDKR